MTFARFVTATMTPALIKLASGFIATLAAMGPAGWAAIAVGAGVATAAILAMTNMLGGPSQPPTTMAGGEEWVLNPTTKLYERAPSFQHGGIVPGPIGAPIPVIAHGGEEFAGPGGFGGVTVIMPNYLGDRSEVTEWMREAFLKIQSRNVTTGLA